MPTNRELEQELTETQADNERLRGQLEQERFETQAENERLRGQLAQTGVGGAPSPAHVTFPARPAYRGAAGSTDTVSALSEGERQDLEINGVTRDPFTGGEILASDYGVEVLTDEGRARLATAQAKRAATPDVGAGIEGVTHVYPSVAPGVLAKDAPVRGGVADTTQIAE